MLDSATPVCMTGSAAVRSPRTVLLKRPRFAPLPPLNGPGQLGQPLPPPFPLEPASPLARTASAGSLRRTAVLNTLQLAPRASSADAKPQRVAKPIAPSATNGIAAVVAPAVGSLPAPDAAAQGSRRASSLPPVAQAAAAAAAGRVQGAIGWGSTGARTPRPMSAASSAHFRFGMSGAISAQICTAALPVHLKPHSLCTAKVWSCVHNQMTFAYKDWARHDMLAPAGL